MMKRPILWALGFLISGIVIGMFYGFSALGLALGLFLCAVLFRVYRYKPVFVFVIFLALGMWRTGFSLHNHTTEPVQVEFSGVVLDWGYTAGANQRVLVRGIHPVTGSNVRIMAFIRPFQPRVELGQYVRLTGELRPLNTPNNPGGYNQFQHLRSQGIDSVMWPDTVQAGEIRRTFTVVLRQFRDALAAVYDELLPSRESAIVKSMILGDRLHLDQDLADLYRVMGIFHILSISGLHVTILMVAANKLLGLVLDERRAGVFVLVIMVLYCLMTGAAVATVRAVTMGGVLVTAKILHREYNLLASVSWACVALLFFQPLYLFNAGFQLSFGAVFGIGTLTAPAERLLMKLKVWKPLRKELSVGIAAVVSTYIVFAFHFYEIPLYSVIGNLVIVPTVTLILVLGVIIGLVGLVYLPAALLLSGTIYYILRFYELAARFFSNLPFAMIQTGGGSIVIAGLGVLVLVFFAYTFHGYGADFRRRGILLIISIAILIASVVIRAHPPRLHITVLDTFGHYLVLRHRGDTLVIGAPRGSEDVLLRYLDKHGVNRAQLLLTQPPRPQDTARLAFLEKRLEIIHLQDGDIRTANGVEKQAIAQFMGRLDLLVTFQDITIAITHNADNDLNRNATVIINHPYVLTQTTAHSTQHHGAIQLQTNGRIVELRTMRP